MLILPRAIISCTVVGALNPTKCPPVPLSLSTCLPVYPWAHRPRKIECWSLSPLYHLRMRPTFPAIPDTPEVAPIPPLPRCLPGKCRLGCLKSVLQAVPAKPSSQRPNPNLDSFACLARNPFNTLWPIPHQRLPPLSTAYRKTLRRQGRFPLPQPVTRLFPLQKPSPLPIHRLWLTMSPTKPRLVATSALPKPIVYQIESFLKPVGRRAALSIGKVGELGTLTANTRRRTGDQQFDGRK